MTRITFVLAACVMVVLGCEKDVRPIYSKPTLSSDQLANIKGTMNFITGTTTYVEEVDGARVEVGLLFPVPPSTQVTPGEHTIGITIEQQEGRSSYTRKTRFKFAFEAGHVYEVDRNGFFDPRVDLKDKMRWHSDRDRVTGRIHFASRFFPRPLLLGSQIFGLPASGSGLAPAPLLIVGAPFISLILSRSCAARSNSRFFAAWSISSSSSLINSV